MPKLTKSLHTVTAATAVARTLFAVKPRGTYASAERLALAALAVLGYPNQDPRTDETVARIVANCAVVLAEAV